MAILATDFVPKLCNEDSYTIEKCSEILLSFKEVTVEVSSEKKCHVKSSTVKYGKGLLNLCTQLRDSGYDSRTVTSFILKLVDKLSNCLLKKYRGMSLVWEATLLDPLFKEHGFSQYGYCSEK